MRGFCWSEEQTHTPLSEGSARRRHASEPRRGMCEEARFSEVKSPSDVHFCPNRTISFPSFVNLRLAVTMVVSELQNKSTAKRQAQRSRHLSGCTLAAQWCSGSGAAPRPPFGSAAPRRTARRWPPTTPQSLSACSTTSSGSCPRGTRSRRSSPTRSSTLSKCSSSRSTSCPRHVLFCRLSFLATGGTGT